VIDEIHARDIALIKEATLVPSKGLTVLTGETGAGKTALLSACKLLCGERADSSMVREDAGELSVEGRVFSGDEECVVSRRVGKDGRSRVSIDGSLASVKELQSKIGPLVDLCGQHEHQQLLKTGTHGLVFDAWAKQSLDVALDAYQQCFSDSQEAAAELERVRQASEASSAQLDQARFILQRIDELNPHEGEYEELAAVLSKAEHAEALARTADTTHGLISGEGAAIDAVQQAASMLESQSSIDENLGAYAQSLREVVFVLEDVSREARVYRDSIDFDPQTLETNQERMSSLQGLMRLYGPRIEDVLAKRAEAAELISLVDESSEREKHAQKVLDEAERALSKAADTLDAIRNERAPEFNEAVNAQLSQLEMAGASIVCTIERLDRKQWTKRGPSHIEFLFKASENMTPRPLNRIASGGEMSRVMLAIKVVLGNADEVETLIFDEVDAGVGGAAAVALAKVLGELAKSHQVIVVTHLAQLAVMGDVHYQVVKRAGSAGKLPETELVELGSEARVEEIARMLSGELSEASLRHAKEMLASR
jgi:DNA repair protein RecN (Recombination protein N)